MLLSPFTADTVIEFLSREKLDLLGLVTYHCTELFTHLSPCMCCCSYFILCVLHFIYIEHHVTYPKQKLKNINLNISTCVIGDVNENDQGTRAQPWQLVLGEKKALSRALLHMFSRGPFHINYSMLL